MSNIIITQIPAVYVRILYHYQLNPLIVMIVGCQILQRHHKSIFSRRTLFIESNSILPNLSPVMEFLGNVFTNFIFEILLSHEALVTESVTSTTTSNNQTQPYKPL